MKTRRINGNVKVKVKDDPGGDRSTPRALMDKTSPQWCRRTLERLKWNIEGLRCSRDQYEKTLGELEEARAWLTLSYPDLDSMLTHEIGNNRPSVVIFTDSATDAARVLLRHFQGEALKELVRGLKEPKP